jgi:hypothetical protein
MIWTRGDEVSQRCAIIDASQDIQMVHKETGNETSLLKARSCLQWAERIYILGFGFDRDNCERLLRPLQDVPSGNMDILSNAQNDKFDPNITQKPISGTSYGVSIHVKKYLFQKGLQSMSPSTRNNLFPDSTIYDWMQNCEYATFD